MRSGVRSAVLAILAIALHGVASAEPGLAAATRCRDAVRRDVSYAKRDAASRSATTLDVYPAPDACRSTPTPVVVWVHGGGWSIGDKERVGAKLDLFHDLGAAVVSVNYRLTDRATDGTGAGASASVRHPDHAVDVADAVGWVTRNAASFGADADQLVLVGHSAGAHLVSLVGTAPEFLRDAEVDDGAVRCVVALDTEGYDLEEKVARGGRPALLVRRVFGDDPQVLRDASPVTHAGDGSESRFLVVTRGSPHRRAEAARFVDAVQQAGGSASLLLAPGYSHADVNRRLGETGDSVVTPAVRDFVSGCVTPGEGPRRVT